MIIIVNEQQYRIETDSQNATRAKGYITREIGSASCALRVVIAPMKQEHRNPDRCCQTRRKEIMKGSQHQLFKVSSTLLAKLLAKEKRPGLWQTEQHAKERHLSHLATVQPADLRF